MICNWRYHWAGSKCVSFWFVGLGLVDCPTQLICTWIFICWVGGGYSIQGVVKCLSPYFTQDWAFLTNFFAKYTCHQNKWELEAKNWFIEVKNIPKKRSLLKSFLKGPASNQEFLKCATTIQEIPKWASSNQEFLKCATTNWEFPKCASSNQVTHFRNSWIELAHFRNSQFVVAQFRNSWIELAHFGNSWFEVAHFRNSWFEAGPFMKTF